MVTPQPTMTLDEAIKRLQESIEEIGNDEIDSLTKAERIGIKAIEVLKHGRTIGQHFDPVLLPGETKE